MIAVDDFVSSARTTGRAAGLEDIRVAAYPGAVAIHTPEQLSANVKNVLFPQIVRLLTQSGGAEAPHAADARNDTGISAAASHRNDTGAPAPGASRPGAGPGTFVPPRRRERPYACQGSFDEINEYFALKGWSDGLPIVPPTREKVDAFLACTGRDAGQVLGYLHPSLRPATVESVAVNGVMAGCEPEYMPVLIAVIEAVAAPGFHLEDAGSSAGWAPMIILNGPAAKRLGFNRSTGLLRPGCRANTSVARFLRLCLRNIAGFIPGRGDMATFGRPDWPVLAEDEDLCPWESLAVSRGFAPGESVVTVSSVGHMSFMLTATAHTPEGILSGIAEKVRLNLLAGDGSTIMKHGSVSHLLGLSPVLAETIASAGYSRRDVQEYIFRHSMVPARVFDRWLELQAKPDACACVRQGLLAQRFCTCGDPERPLPLYHSADELMIAVCGTRERNRFFIAEQVGRQGLASSAVVDAPVSR